MKTRSRTFIATAAAIAGTTLLAPGIASADPVFSGEVDGQSIINNDQTMVGNEVMLSGQDCMNPSPGDPAYFGEFVSMSEDPLVSPGTASIPFEEEVMTGSFEQAMMTDENSVGTYYVRWYCSTASQPAVGTVGTNPDLLWVSDLYTFEIMMAPGDARSGADAKAGAASSITIDPDGLPAVDRMGIHGDRAADLKAVVDYKAKNIATAQRLYSAFLGRPADSAGLTYWTGQLDKGVSIRTLANRFANTAEFREGRGELSDSAFVDAMYTSILGRSADSDGRAFWLSRLEDGASRASVVASFANSRENVAKTANLSYVVASYHVLTGSVPSRSEVAAQVAKLDDGQVKVKVVEDIALTAKSAEEWMQAG